MSASFLKRYSFLFFALFIFSSFTLLRAEDDFEDDEADEDVGTVIGIDLGTTYSVVGVYQNGKVDIIANDQGNRITPSYVAFTDEERLVGESAKNQAAMNPTNTVYSAKRLIGRRFSEPSVQKDLKLLSYKVIEKQNIPYIKVRDKKKDVEYSPQEISAIVLGAMKKIAENYIGKKVTHAVVTVPAYFNDAQRKATQQAGTIAGLNVMRIINEPTAAAIAYGMDKKKDKEQNILVYDLGGGTFDVSFLTVEGGVFEVKATNGHTHLGGEDFDINLAKHFASIFKKKTNIDVLKDKKAFAKLKKQSEVAKRALSTLVKTTVEIENLAGGKDFKETVTRAQFEKLNMKLFKDTLKPVATVLKDAKMSKKDVDEVVLVGGSTRISIIQQMISDFFEGKKVNKNINPDEAVAVGAAIQGFILSGSKDDQTKDMLLLDVTPLSLGIETVGGIHTKVINKNVPIPTSKSQTFTTNENDQTTVTISIYEGEAKMIKNNHFLGRFDLVGIDKAPRGVPQIEVTFEIDANGILTVSAKDKSSGKNNKININEAMSGSSSEEVKRMRENFEKYQKEDEKLFNNTVARNKMSSAIHSATDFKKKEGEKLSKEDLDDVESLIAESTKWLEEHTAESTDAEEFTAKANEIEELIKELKTDEKEDGEDGEEDEEEDGEDEDDDKEKEKDKENDKKDKKDKKEL